ncbi:MAG TPA: hypothetical protein VGL25_05610 [Casimicrobiaceae bacterium]
MGIWDRFGSGIGMQRNTTPSTEESDEQAIARYRYMLKTAPPETIEQAHAEAFAALTPEQRRKVLQRLSDEIPEAERAAAAGAGDTPGSLARLATRAEIRQPGAIERAFGGIGSGAPGLGGMVAGSLLGSMAGTVLGGMVAQHFFGSHPEAQHLFGDAHDSHSKADSSNADDAIRSDTDNLADASDTDGDVMSGFDGTDMWDT